MSSLRATTSKLEQLLFFRLSTLGGGGGGDDGKEKQHIIEEEFLGWFLGTMFAIEDTLASWYDSNIEDTLFLVQENRYTASLFLYRLTPPSSHKFGQTSPLKRTAGLASSSLSPSIDKLQNAAKTNIPIHFVLHGRCEEDKCERICGYYYTFHPAQKEKPVV